MKTLADRIEERIRAIRASNRGYITVRQETLSNLLENALLRKIAEVAADEAEKKE